MTKFPESNVGDDAKLKAIIEEVQKTIADVGLIPRIATFEYHEELRRNVELYLLGSAKGVAIVEDRCRKEMNPNVAFEWGWMKGANASSISWKKDSRMHAPIGADY